MTDMFKDVKVGDCVYDILRGWGKVTDVREIAPSVRVDLDEGVWDWFYTDGKHRLEDLHPRLYWDEVDLPEPPSKPLPDLEVDTPVLVTNGPIEVKAHFHSHAPGGGVYVYSWGRSSHTAILDSTGLPMLGKWLYWSLAEDPN